jgi:hypothetical protein
MSRSFTPPLGACRRRARVSLICASLCIAALFIVISTRVRVERVGHSVRLHFAPAVRVRDRDPFKEIAL